MKKGQIAGQIFIYIMAVIIIGGIALIAYSAINSIFPKVCDTEKITFKSDLESYLEKYTSYGSVNKQVIAAPCDYETVCFVDHTKIGDSGFTCNGYAIIADSVHSGVQENVFVLSGQKTVGLTYSDFVSLADPSKCTCIKQRNKNFYITFNGKGASVEVDETASS